MSLGATIPYSKFTSCSRAGAATMRLRSVEVVEIDPASPGLGHAAANHGGRCCFGVISALLRSEP